MPETDLQKRIFEAIAKNDTALLKTLLTGGVDFTDENGMTPLQHACYKGNKEAVRLLLDQVRPTFTLPVRNTFTCPFSFRVPTSAPASTSTNTRPSTLRPCPATRMSVS